MTGEEVIFSLGDGFSSMSGLATLDAICCEQKDREAVESVLPFLGKAWPAISNLTWRDHSRAVTFFSHRAFLYYLPSLIQHSLRTPELAEGAVDSLVFSLRPYELIPTDRIKTRKWHLSADQIESLTKWRLDRWRLFNNRQLLIVSAWLGILCEFSLYDNNTIDFQSAQLTLKTIARS